MTRLPFLLAAALLAALLVPLALTETGNVQSADPPEGHVEQIQEASHLFFGRAIQDGLPLSDASQIQAWVAGTLCGDGSIRAAEYELYVLSSTAKAGCAEDGDEIVITIDGREAGRSTFQEGALDLVTLVSGPVPMYFPFGYSLNLGDGMVVPYIGLAVCGEALPINTFPGVENGQHVYVVSAETTPGCGAPGEVVTLTLEGGRVVGQVIWEEGVANTAYDPQRLGDANCVWPVDSEDALLILQHSAGLFDDLKCSDASDVNRDAVVDSADAQLILSLTSGLIEYFE